MNRLLYNLDQVRRHYRDVLEAKPPLYYERFDRQILQKRPLVRCLVAKLFDNLFPEKAGSLLDIGCGTGFYYPLLAHHAESISGIDVCRPMLEQAHDLIKEKGLTNCQVTEASALAIPFENDSIDVVLSWDFLHHVSNVPQAISEITRVLRPHGRYLALEPNLLNPSIGWYHLRRRSEWRLFVQNQFTIPRILDAGFETLVTYDNTIISFLNERTWRIWRIVDRITRASPFRFLSFRYILDCRRRNHPLSVENHLGSESEL